MFLQRLKNAVKEFDLDQARVLSDEIHNSEAGGYELGPLEDLWWMRLTDLLEKSKSNP